MRPLIYAHRGSSGEFAEHTRAAYLQALADGVDGVECDVRLTEDKQLVLLHDATLDRTSNGTGSVSDYSLRELWDLDFCSWKGADIPEEYGGVSDQLLTLNELLDLLRAAGRPLGLAIELKHPSSFGQQLEERTLALLRAEGWDPASSVLDNLQITFMSFSPDALEFLAETVPTRYLCQLVADVDADVVTEELGLGRLAGTAVTGMLRNALAEGERRVNAGMLGWAGPGVDYVRAHPDRIRSWLDAGIQLRVWTVDEPAEVELCLAAGIQEFTTNWPARVHALLPAGSVVE
jgi:glycerophosphoryl diester phosphodiesterase